MPKGVKSPVPEGVKHTRLFHRADINVRLHILSRATAGIHGAQDPAMAEALKRFDLLDRVNAALQALRGENFAGFMHTASATNHAHDEIVEDVECFRTSVQDTSAMRPVSRIVGLSAAIK